MDEEMKRFLQEELKKEADQIMREVEADPEVADLTAPSEIDQKLYEQIKQYKEEHYAPEETLSGEQQELIRLGKIYKRKQKRRKYVVLAAAVVSAFAVGITSFGGPEWIFHKFNNIMAGRDQMVLNSDDEDVTEAKVSTEEEAYQKIKDEFGFDPVRLLYLPGNMKFQELVIFQEMQNIHIVYGDGRNKTLRCQMTINYRNASTGFDVEDQMFQEKSMEVEGVPIKIRYFEVEKEAGERASAIFEYQDIQYLLSINNIKEEEFEEILKNLKFF